MRKLLILLGMMVSFSAFGADAQLKMKISGPINDNRYFLCVSHVGCVSILNGNKGKIYPMTEGPVNNIVMINVGTRLISPQSLPASCNITVASGQTMKISGQLTKGANDHAILKNLRCVIS